jgi:transcriptional regulator with XRE-family HTH domain
MIVDAKNLKIGERLRMLRLRAKKKQKEIADAIGVDGSTLCLLEQGRRTWTPEMVDKYERAVA